MKGVVVLMSVYNGERHLREQLDSLLAQKDVAIQIVVRDDGSSDKTAEILASYIEGNAPITYVKGKNVGAAKSFMRLVGDCGTESPYYAFSDHDDVWQSDKLIAAVHALEACDSKDTPLMYCSRLTIVDEKLNYLGLTRVPKKPLTFSNALVETVTSGGTILLNREAIDLLRKYTMDDIVMHDSWAYLVVSAFGKIHYDETPRILYRQHSSNIFGGRHGLWKRWALRIDKLFEKQNPFRKQAMEFLNKYQCHLSARNECVLLRYVNYKGSWLKRVMFALSPTVNKQLILSSLYMRLLILLGKL